MTHVVQNITEDEELRGPLLLTIQGHSGEGKTFQVREACGRLGVHLLVLSGASLSGEYEGEPVKLLRAAYMFASDESARSGIPIAILIDDFDLSCASSFQGREYTVNTQLLTGFLMNLADAPTRLNGMTTLRIPIILTGNDFTALHGPLVRHERMTFFEWAPSETERFRMAYAIVAPLVSYQANLNDLRAFISAHLDRPIAFFAGLRSSLRRAAIARAARRTRSVTIARIATASLTALRAVTVTDLWDAAAFLKAARPHQYRCELKDQVLPQGGRA
jgi:hypothetical protein